MVIFKFTKRRDYLSAISLLVVLVYVLVINPVLLLIQSGRFSINSAPVALTGTNLTDGSVLNKAFWVVLAFYQLYILLLNREKIFYANLKFYLPIIALVLLEFLSTLWSAEAEVTLRRSLQQQRERHLRLAHAPECRHRPPGRAGVRHAPQERRRPPIAVAGWQFHRGHRSARE